MHKRVKELSKGSSFVMKRRFVVKSIISRIIARFKLDNNELMEFVIPRMIEILVQLIFVWLMSFVRLDFEVTFLIVMIVDVCMIIYYTWKYKLIDLETKVSSFLNIVLLGLPFLMNIQLVIIILLLSFSKLYFGYKVLLIIVFVIVFLYFLAASTKAFLKDKLEFRISTQLLLFAGISCVFLIPTYLSFQLKDEGVAALTWFVPLLTPMLFDLGIFGNNVVLEESYFPTEKFHYLRTMLTIFLSEYVFNLQMFWQLSYQKQEFFKMLPYIKEYDETWWSYTTYIALPSLVLALILTILLDIIFQSLVSNKANGLVMTKRPLTPKLIRRQFKYKRLKK
ncbi:hypothetical protein HO671_02900 [Streptococcus suis]|uniref:hypothetical protein n=1 Tax=Streptococcus suis TaxID=1307 RepID=UPI0005CD261E|nr:hypothetical protein [Streptococcus suis]NQH10993.1 hypothetical protein [Streptococcus suis]NQH22792.1 hypothetical protein [Streptococcus suis]NQN37905.1 hypothetical protein [Streptococcus suis]HEM5895982.1 hypothetical protein [Streptococcus suis]HEM5935959.1 hypothetical protein [Streptococcus suis]